jgi:hypothetical protein
MSAGGLHLETLLAELYEAVCARMEGGILAALEGLSAGEVPAFLGAGERAAYQGIYCSAPDAEPAARAMMAPLIDRSCSDLEMVRGVIRDDPAAPHAEAACRFLLWELGWLAAVYSSASPGPDREIPDPRDEYAADYARIAVAIRELLGLMDAQQPLWRFLRESRAAARARPPRRPRPRRPMADDREYYF